MKIEEFKPFIPLIQGLRNPGMRSRHWDQVIYFTDPGAKECRYVVSKNSAIRSRHRIKIYFLIQGLRKADIRCKHRDQVIYFIDPGVKKNSVSGANITIGIYFYLIVGWLIW